MKVQKVIEEIKKRPAMFLGYNSISCLKSFIDGMFYISYEKIEDKDFLINFQSYVENKYANFNHSWDRILLSNSNNEESALNLFFDEMVMFQSQ